MFQFLSGSIKSIRKQAIFDRINFRFNSFPVRLKAFSYSAFVYKCNMFQFLSGSIKSERIGNSIALRYSSFNSFPVRLKENKYTVKDTGGKYVSIPFRFD